MSEKFINNKINKLKIYNKNNQINYKDEIKKKNAFFLYQHMYTYF